MEWIIWVRSVVGRPADGLGLGSGQVLWPIAGALEDVRREVGLEVAIVVVVVDRMIVRFPATGESGESL
ncbi:hypothetical protein TIFTF001_022502 [Ficus carica]|uniref:Uncharacterized protein n=1 Tax=Ficus carica TaxID=3494 RepID=A0AA88AK23_FICCA|nr:hypothetical protein TIFTF001_022502 [Ficus carica]